MNVTTAGIDLAKNAFILHGVDQNGKIRLRRKSDRGDLLPISAKMP